MDNEIDVPIVAWEPVWAKGRHATNGKWTPPHWHPGRRAQWEGSLSLGDFARKFSEVLPFEDEKGRVPSWSPIVSTDGIRRLASVMYVSAVVFDLDDGDVDKHDVSAAFPGTLAIYHTSWKHTEEAPRGRLILPLGVLCPADKYGLLWAHMAARWPDRIDAHCKDSSRAWYAPRCPPEALHMAYGWVIGQEPYEVDYATLKAPEAPKPPPMPKWTGKGSIHTRGYREDPAMREALCYRLNGTKDGNRVTHVTCPKCGRKSVWWYIRPEYHIQAACNHRNSCGGLWFLDQLAAIYKVH